MPKTPAQARFNKLKHIYEHANNERLIRQQRLEDGKADLLTALETTQQALDAGELGEQINAVNGSEKSGVKK